MAAQTREQDRYLGGRPPYGYRLADAGPHPNKAHAAWGWRAHRLDVRAAAGRAQRSQDHPGAERFRDPVPVRGGSGTEPAPDRRGMDAATVAAILANPRYTGRQVWNRQRTDFDLADPANTALGYKQVQPARGLRPLCEPGAGELRWPAGSCSLG
jgi:site-specific DNA recombinase